MISAQSHSSEVDVVVVGGGAAGIAAARRLADEGLEVLLLEGGPKLGGRARTEFHGGFPLDLGCGWLHSADRNTWATIAHGAGVEIDKTKPPWERQTFNHELSAADQAEFRKVFGDFDRRIDKAKLVPDRAASDFLEANSRWNPLIDAISTWFNGVELRAVSALDYQHYEDREKDWRIPSGYGALIADYAKPIPAMLSTRVREIDHGGARLRLITERGTLLTRAAVITVPTPVIAEERLRFTPALPDKVEAAGHLPLGTVNKVFLTCSEVEMFPPDGHLFGHPFRVDQCSYHLRPFGRPLIEAYVGGRLAKDLAAQGEAQASTDFAIAELVDSLGSDMRKKLKPLTASAWESEELIGGAYSHAQVGCVPARRLLAQPVEERLFFAGEACSATAYSTAHGAYETGRRAAEEAIVALLRRPRLILPLAQTREPRRGLSRSQKAAKPKKEKDMAKYSESAGDDVERAMHKRKKGTLKSGPGGKGGTVKSRKQAIAIGLSEARAKGKKVPKKKARKK